VTRPASTAELGTISGVGEKKLEQYGDALLAVVAGAAMVSGG
jgi:ATP-dependent DNA helicase RecQ